MAKRTKDKQGAVTFLTGADDSEGRRWEAGMTAGPGELAEADLAALLEMGAVTEAAETAAEQEEVTDGDS